MPAADYQSSSVPFASLGFFSTLSIRGDWVYDMKSGGSGDAAARERELEVFQRNVTVAILDLTAGGDADVLSLAWVRRLLDAFVPCLEEFEVILVNGKAGFKESALATRLFCDFFDRGLKALDILNAIRDGAEQLRQWQRHLEIAVLALHEKPEGRKGPLGEGHIRRAKKALTEVAISPLDQKDFAASILSNRHRSFGRAGGSPSASSSSSSSSKDHYRRPGGHHRSHSWSVPRSWSAARQVQAIASNLAAPRNSEILSTKGLAVPAFTMSWLLLFMVWALVAAFPCPDRGLQTHFSIPRNYLWAQPILSLHEKIFEESKKKDRKNSAGLLKEIHQIEKCTRHLLELIDTSQFPLPEEREVELRQSAAELNQICEVLKDGLDPMEQQVRAVFRRLMSSRIDGLERLGRTHWS